MYKHIDVLGSYTLFHIDVAMYPGEWGGQTLALTADGVGAPSTLLGVQVAEAAQAVGKLVPGREALPRQRFLAGCAYKTLPVPGLLPVSDAPGGDGLEEARVQGQVPSRETSVLSTRPQSQLLLLEDATSSARKHPILVKSHREATVQTS